MADRDERELRPEDDIREDELTPEELAALEEELEEERHLHVVIVTGDRLVYDGLADRLIAPASKGQITVLPKHVALLAMLEPGEMVVKLGHQERPIAVGGGFIEVRDDQVIVLADTAELAEEIDIERAEQARRNARTIMRRQAGKPGEASAREALRRSRARLRAARHGQRQR